MRHIECPLKWYLRVCVAFYPIVAASFVARMCSCTSVNTARDRLSRRTNKLVTLNLIPFAFWLLQRRRVMCNARVRECLNFGASQLYIHGPTSVWFTKSYDSGISTYQNCWLRPGLEFMPLDDRFFCQTIFALFHVGFLTLKKGQKVMWVQMYWNFLCFLIKKKKKFSWGYGCGKKILTFFIPITVCDTYTSLLTPNLKLKSTLWRFIDNVVQKFWTLTDSHARALVLGYSSGITFITTGDRVNMPD